MRKTILIISCIALMLLCGCRSENKEKSGDVRIDFYKDPKTGVEYIIYGYGYRGGICPRYNADGTLYTGE